MRTFARIAAVLVLLTGSLLAVLHSTLDGGVLATAPLSAARIAERGVLRVAFRAGTLSFFLHHGQPMGFEYELLSGFAGPLGVRLEARVVSTAAEAELWLRQGRVDLAVLSPERTHHPELMLVPSYVPAASADPLPPTGAIYLRNDGAPLRAALGAYVSRRLQETEGVGLYGRYFGSRSTVVSAEDLDYKSKRLRRYRSIIAPHAKAAGYDWRLVAALIFCESRFDPAAVSGRGAVGLMQVMPATGEAFGFRRLHDPDTNLRAGMRYLKHLSTLFAESQGEDHLAMTLTAYLIGPGHVRDAQELARSVGLDPNAWWDGVAEVLPLLEDPRFFSKARHGYAQGRHAVNYVHQIVRLQHRLRAPKAAAGLASVEPMPPREANG